MTSPPGRKLVSHTVPPQQCFRLMSEDMLALIWSASKTLDWKVIHCFVPVLEKKPHSCTFTSMNWYGYCETVQKICSPPPRKIIFTPKSQVYLFSALPTIHFLRFQLWEFDVKSNYHNIPWWLLFLLLLTCLLKNVF